MKTQEHHTNFWKRVKITANPDRCWVWTGATSRAGGYGRVYKDGHQLRAHRIAWLLTYGREPKGILLHSCDNPPCVNPSHLREGTPKENAVDRVVRGRQPAKLTHDMVREIRTRLANGEKQRVIAEDYPVNIKSIGHIASGHTWASVD